MQPRGEILPYIDDHLIAVFLTQLMQGATISIGLVSYVCFDTLIFTGDLLTYHHLDPSQEWTYTSFKVPIGGFTSFSSYPLYSFFTFYTSGYLYKRELNHFKSIISNLIEHTSTLKSI